ncbi:hypothetical protein VTK26DRAFT_3497 [Humicola hyalothermophila]
MAALIGDVFADSSSRFHGMIRGHSHDIHCQSRSVSRSRDRDARSHHAPCPTASPPRHGSTSLATVQSQMEDRPERENVSQDPNTKQTHANRSSAHTTRLPSPPPSSSASSETSSGGAQPRDEIPRAGAHDPTPASVPASHSSASSASTATTVIPAPRPSIPSPDSDSAPSRGPSRVQIPAHSYLSNIAPESPVQTQKTIRIRDLAHIQSLANADMLTATGPGTLNDPPLQQMKYEISGMPIGDIIEMVAALLTKITTTNDLQHDAFNRNAHHLRQAQAQENNGGGSSSAAGGEAGGGMSPLSSSVLAFHGKNVPAITILSYLSRIHKYCPTTYEVFLSLLVYFDRMTERVNDLVVKSEEARRQQQQQQQQQQQHQQQQQQQQAQSAATVVDPGDRDTVMRDREDDNEAEEEDEEIVDEDDESDRTETDSELADDTDGEGEGDAGQQQERVRSGRRSSNGATDGKRTASHNNTTTATATGSPAATAAQQATYFVVDSFNIHRLIIAGVTCASKFFSDVFYTNSRYAKVGGLPLAELNHLELQFLLLNDFRLAVPVEDLEAYATMLVEFYAREVVAHKGRAGE